LTKVDWMEKREISKNNDHNVTMSVCFVNLT